MILPQCFAVAIFMPKQKELRKYGSFSGREKPWIYGNVQSSFKRYKPYAKVKRLVVHDVIPAR